MSFQGKTRSTCSFIARFDLVFFDFVRLSQYAVDNRTSANRIISNFTIGLCWVFQTWLKGFLYWGCIFEGICVVWIVCGGVA